MSKVINEEIKKWSDRIYFGDLKFKEENSNPDSPFYQTIKVIANNMLDNKFQVVGCEYESQTYKIARMMIEKFGLINDDFTFENGINLEAYIGNAGGTVWELQDRAKTYVQNNRQSFKNKIIIIPMLNFEVAKFVSIYMMDQLEAIGVKGLIFSYEGNNYNSLMHSLALSNYNKLIQFPKVSIQLRGHQITDDGL